MKHAARLTVGAVVAFAGALTIACQNGVSGPSLSATIVSMTLQPTVTAPSSENICCCHVVGSVKNTSSVTAHVQLQFPAKAGGTEVGRAIDLERDLAPGAVRAFEAPGLMVACSSIDPKQVLSDAIVRVIGLWEPI
jgi:hypothetical protein